MDNNTQNPELDDKPKNILIQFASGYYLELEAEPVASPNGGYDYVFELATTTSDSELRVTLDDPAKEAYEPQNSGETARKELLEAFHDYEAARLAQEQDNALVYAQGRLQNAKNDYNLKRAILKAAQSGVDGEFLEELTKGTMFSVKARTLSTGETVIVP